MYISVCHLVDTPFRGFHSKSSGGRMMADTRETILRAARTRARAHGYGGLNFRDLATDVGIKSASIHYHFPTKADLGAAVAKRCWEDSGAALETLWAQTRIRSSAFPVSFARR
jgi:AcrR family transcriptional regulator